MLNLRTAECEEILLSFQRRKVRTGSETRALPSAIHLSIRFYDGTDKNFFFGIFSNWLPCKSIFLFLQSLHVYIMGKSDYSLRLIHKFQIVREKIFLRPSQGRKEETALIFWSDVLFANDVSLCTLARRICNGDIPWAVLAVICFRFRVNIYVSPLIISQLDSTRWPVLGDQCDVA